MTSYLIYDCEIMRCIPDRDGYRNPEFEYCDGWDDHANMGVTTIGWHFSSQIWDGKAEVSVNENSELPWMCDRFSTALDLADIIIGFNSKSFDDALVHANGLLIATDYDLLEEIREVAYGSKSWKDTPPGYSYSLGVLGQANGVEKTGTGERAPELWQKGDKQSVIDYCKNDVLLTRHILLLGLEGKLKDPNNGRLLQLRLPQEGLI